MAFSLGDAVLNITGDVRGLNQALGDAERATKRSFGNVLAAAQKIGVGMTAVGGAIVAGLGAMVKKAADFDLEMTKAFSIMGDLSAEMKTKMADLAKQLSGESTFAATDLAQAYYFLSSAGLNAEQQIAALPQVVKFATAGAFDLATATDLATDAQSALGMGSNNAAKHLENLTRVTDVLVSANNLSNASVQQFSESLTNKAGAALKTVGKDIEEGTAVLAAFADQGLKGSEAGTALGIVMRELQTKGLRGLKDDGEKAATATQKVMEKIKGLQVDLDIANRKMIEMSQSSKTSQSALMGQNARIQELRDKLQAAKEQLAELTGGSAESANAWKKLGLSVYDAQGEMRNMGDIVADLEKKLTGMSDAQVKSTMAQLGFNDKSMGFIQTLLGTSEKIKGYEKALRDAGGTTQDVADKQMQAAHNQFKMLTNQLANLSIDIGNLLIPALLGLMNTIKPVVAEAVNWIKQNKELATSIVKWVAVAGGIMFVLGPILIALPGLISLFTALKVLFAALMGPIGLVVAGIAGLYMAWKSNFLGIRTITQAGWEFVKKITKYVWTGTIGLITGAWDGLVKFFTGAYAVFRDGWRAFWESIAGIFKDIWEGIKNTFTAVWDTISGAMDSIGDFASGAWQGAKGLVGFAAGTPSAPGGLALIGERGPELVNLPRGSRVYDANQTRGMLAAGAGGLQVNIGAGAIVIQTPSVKDVSEDDLLELGRRAARAIKRKAGR